MISFFNFSFFYFFSCIFAEIDFLLSSCRASISESDNRPSGTYGDSGDLSPLTFDKYLNPVPIREGGGADYVHHI